MTAPADLVVTQLSVEAGEAQESADFITVSRPAGLWPLRRRTDQFCALLAPDRPGQGALCRQILDVMEREFSASGGRSATSALAAVLLAAHHHLRRENSLSMPEERVRMQAAVAVLRSGGAYLGRVGPTFAGVRHRGVLQRFLGVPTSENGAESTEERLLGGEVDPQIAYAFSSFAPDDLLVLASGPQWERMRPDYIEAAMDEGEPSAVASALYELGVWRQTRPTFSILVLEARAPERRGLFPRTAVPAEEEIEEEEYATVSTRRRRRGAEAPARTERTYDDGDYGTVRYPDSDGYAEHDYPAENGYNGHAVRERPRRRPGRPGGAYADDGALVAPNDLPGRARVAFDRLTRVTAATVPPRALLVALAAVALTTLFLLVFAVIPIFRPPPDHASALAAQAQSYYEQVRRAPESANAREQLDQSRQLLTQALALRETPAWRGLLSDTQAELDRIDKVVRLPSAEPLIELGSLGADTAVTRVIVEGTDVYVLDVGGARLLRYQLQADGSLQSAEPQVLTKRGERVGNSVVGNLIGMAWVGTDGPRTDPGLVVVESGRTFITYNPRAGVGRVAPADSPSWNEVSAVAAFRGNVYLVDPKRPSIMEYRPTRSGYEGPPFAALDGRANVAWDRVVDLQVDGTSLYVLQGDGILRKYARERGEPQPFSSQVPDSLRGPIAVTQVGNADARQLFVADMGNERVVQLALDGAYQRQFRPPSDSKAFGGLRDVFVDANNRLYVLTTQALYRYDLAGE
jgi:hypothetical protein